MNLVRERSVAFWNNENLVVCFVEALIHLNEGLKRGDIRDVFIPEVKSNQLLKLQLHIFTSGQSSG